MNRSRQTCYAASSANAFIPRPELRRQFLRRLALLRNCSANLLGREIGSRHSFLLQPLEELQWVVWAPLPFARSRAICSRSAKDKYRPESGGADGVRYDGGIPPASRNHRTPTGDDTPTLTAAASLMIPAAMAIQNRRRFAR